MFGSGLEKIAAEKNLKIFKGVAYGDVRGYFVNLKKGPGYTKWIIFTKFEDENLKARISQLIYDKETKKKLNIKEFYLHKMYIQIRVGGTKVSAFEDWIFHFLRSEGIQGVTCSYCDTTIGGAPETLKMVNGVIFPYHFNCAHNFDLEIEENKQNHLYTNKNYVKGFLAALLGALLASIPWAFAYFIGWFVGWLGYLIGFAAKKGYELAGGKVGKGKIAIVISVTIVGVVFAQLLGDGAMINAEIVKGNFAGYTQSEILTIMYRLFTEIPEYLTEFLKNIAIGLFFAFLGIYSILKNIKTETSIAIPKVIDVE